MRGTRRNTAVTVVSTLALAAVLLSGCAGSRGPGTSPAPTPSTSVPPVTLTPTPTPEPTPVITPTPPADATTTALDSVILACQTWQTSLAQASSEYPATQDKARQLALDAVAADAQWTQVADDMTTLVEIGTDSSAEAVAKGQAAFTRLSDNCRAVGVVVSGG